MDNHIYQLTDPAAPGHPSVKRLSWSRWVWCGCRDVFSTLVPALAIALLIHLFLAQATRVYGQSMEPGLYENQRLVIEKISYHLHGPRRGDVIVLQDPGGSDEMLIKRVVGLPGERITVKAGKVFVDGRSLKETYVVDQATPGSLSWIVPPLHVFVMGDNRGASRDSRTFGAVPIEDIVGRAVFRYWPLQKFGILH